MLHQRGRRRQRLIVIGNGMVGHRLIEELVSEGGSERFEIVVLGDEARLAYDRVRLTSVFSGTPASKLQLAPSSYYEGHGVELALSDGAVQIEPLARQVVTESGRQLGYDRLVVATGARPFVPPIFGAERPGVFVYRTLDDVERIRAYGSSRRRAVVIGGGLLGLEAAKAVHDLGLETTVVELASRLMPRQLDDIGGSLLRERVEALGIRVLTGCATRAVTGDGNASASGVVFEDGARIGADMVVISAGIVPRDDLARRAGLELAPRGGIVVDDQMRTSDPAILAIGDVAVHRGIVSGLVAPGYAMAEVAAGTLLDRRVVYGGSKLSARLKLLGVEVASFGDALGETAGARAVVCHDGVNGVYRRVNLCAEMGTLLGGMLVGDTSTYGVLLEAMEGGEPMPEDRGWLVLGGVEALRAGVGGTASGLSAGASAADGEAKLCSCHGVTKADVKAAIAEALEGGAALTLEGLKGRTRAGTGCGGCLPELSGLLQEELAAPGEAPPIELCEHFRVSRTELFEIIKVKEHRSFEAVLEAHGSGAGCEVCKPTVASVLASLWNEDVTAHATVQDTNDRFLANIQRGGTYSVVPRVPGGEITPEKLIVLGSVAKKHGLYTKITGGQRVDLLGAHLHQLPGIWEELVGAGFESGHAYGKAMRTVKSCVGSDWCRFGVQDAVGLAIRIENRYKGIRAPHKLKSAVSGCMRECAEARSKDFGVIATEKGWDLYVCGNGGARPRHGDLLVSGVDDERLIQLIDRFLVYYIHTADRLQRTAAWLEALEGGIRRLRQVVVEDVLGIGEELEAQMERLASSYRCEWTEVVRDPEKRAAFRHFANSREVDPAARFVSQRGQRRPAAWVPWSAPAAQAASAGDDKGPSTSNRSAPPTPPPRWVRLDSVDASVFPSNGGRCVRVGDAQIAVFHFASVGRWFACENACPHTGDMVLARGLLGTEGGVPKVACPHHKKTFSLKSGECLSDRGLRVKTFDVRVGKDGSIFLLLPSELADATSRPEERSLGDEPVEGHQGTATLIQIRRPGV